MKYCDEGQETASITVQGLRYLTKSPPLTVETSQVVIPAYRQAILTIVQYPNGIISEELLPSPFTRGSAYVSTRYFEGYAILSVDLFIDESFVRTLKAGVRYTYGDGTTRELESIEWLISHNAVPAKEGYRLLAVDGNNQIIFSATGDSIPTYKINCDECNEGECKGRKDRYPGYDCLDCKQMQQRINNMRMRIDGIK